jgi:hypothetical protein
VSNSGAVDGPVPEIDTTKPHSARMYDYWLGGKDNFAADRAVAESVQAAYPAVRIGARENRAFLGRAVRYLAAEAGVRQFLDIGSGLPTTNNVHEVAQAVTPSSHVVYVDNDPLVHTHARALLSSAPGGRTAYIQADARQPEAILSHPVTQEVLDFGQPIALILAAVLHFIPDEDKPAEVLATLLGPMAPGSYLVASHFTTEHDEERFTSGGQAYAATIRVQARDSGDFARLAFSGLELVPPGVVLASEWRPNPGTPRPTPAEVSNYAGVARKR